MDRDDIEAALAGTSLAGLPIDSRPDGAVLVSGIDPARLLVGWQEAHRLLPVIGRWPLLVSRPPQAPPGGGPSVDRLAELDQAARTIDPWPAFHPGDDRPVLKADAGGIARGFRGLDLTREVQRKLKFPLTEQELGRWIYKRVLTDPEFRPQVEQAVAEVVRTDFWFTPDTVALLFLPTASPWLAAAWSRYPGVERPDDLAAALWQWHDQWDVRPVACWDAVLQVTVGRPPTAGIEAWTVAGQILSLADGLELQRWELAMVLPGGDAWLLPGRT